MCRVAGIVAIIALCGIPISYALSTGIERGVEAAAKQLPLRGLLPKIEQSIVEFGKPDYDLPPERAEALGEAIARIVARLAPFTNSAAGVLYTDDTPAVPASEPGMPSKSSN